MTIKEVEETVHIDRANIRYYEKEGLLFTRRNPLNGYREYTQENVECLRKIIFLRNLGIPIHTIRELQSGKESFQNALERQADMIREETERLRYRSRICRELSDTVNSMEPSFATLDISRYQEEGESRDSEILADAVSLLTTIKETVILWGVILLSFLISIIAFPLLPERIPIAFHGPYITREGGKWFLLLLPILEILIAVSMKSLVTNVILKHIPILLLYIEEITEYFSIWYVVGVCFYEIQVVLYAGGYLADFSTGLTLLFITFVIFSIVRVTGWMIRFRTPRN